MSSLSEQERNNLQKYGQMPKRPLATHSRVRERKYFDSGDYALSKAGNKEVEVVGQDHPSPTSIPHYVSSPAAEQQPLAKSLSDAVGTPIVDTDSPTSTMVNPSCLATESNANTITPPPEALKDEAQKTHPSPAFGVLPAVKKDTAHPAFNAPAAVTPIAPGATTAPANAPPPARPTFTRRVSQVAGTQYRVKD
ncbi:hypothetical protein LPJ59_003216 [Coemansia sp. RSA 2399]|nr:hypothetical protein LPJ59_003216 [Coemansia sp. RSA 2399]KAJ1903795.1 hypothetical protein LPJ81_002870 [Coemansia sp. IMI 209127]